LYWEGYGLNEVGYLINLPLTTLSPIPILRIDPRYFRPAEVQTLLGDPSKAKSKLGWEPRISFPEMVKEMVQEDFKSAERDQLVKRHGYYARNYQK
jgi:GDPmannose 4,6-dehydratase